MENILDGVLKGIDKNIDIRSKGNQLSSSQIQKMANFK